MQIGQICTCTYCINGGFLIFYKTNHAKRQYTTLVGVDPAFSFEVLLMSQVSTYFRTNSPPSRPLCENLKSTRQYNMVDPTFLYFQLPYYSDSRFIQVKQYFC